VSERSEFDKFSEGVIYFLKFIRGVAFFLSFLATQKRNKQNLDSCLRRNDTNKKYPP